MKTPFKISLALAVAGLAFAGGAQAQTASNSGYSLYGPGSSYIGFNLGQSNFRLGNGNGAFASEQRKTAYSLYGGSYFNDYLGVELGYTDFGRVSRAGGETRANGFNVGLVGRLPLNSSFNLLGRVGTTYGRTEVSSNIASGVTAGSETGWGGSYGIGAEYNFNSQMSAVLQYDEYNLKFAGGNRDRINTTSVGLRYKF
jgi:OOP family OmpA-OmpF porin